MYQVQGSACWHPLKWTLSFYTSLAFLPLESYVSHMHLDHQQFQDKLLHSGKAGIPFSAMCFSKTGVDKAPVIVHQGPRHRGQACWLRVSLCSLVCEVGQCKTRDHRTWWNMGTMPPSHRASFNQRQLKQVFFFLKYSHWKDDTLRNM